MAFELEELEVDFFEYCVQCKHKNVSETKEPCNECLANPSNRNSHKPVKWEAKE